MKKVVGGIVLSLVLTMGTGIVGAQELPNEPSKYDCEAVFVKADGAKSKIEKSLEKLEESDLDKKEFRDKKIKAKAEKLGISEDELKEKIKSKKQNYKKEFEKSGLTKEEFRERKIKQFETKKNEMIKKKAKELGITEEEMRAKIEAHKKELKKEFEDSGLSKQE